MCPKLCSLPWRERALLRKVENSIIFPHSAIGRDSHIRRAIIERGVSIPAGSRIGFNLEEDRKKYYVTESGIVVVVPEHRVFEESPPNREQAAN